MEFIEYETLEPGIDMVTLDRPHVRNAINLGMRDELLEVFEGRDFSDTSVLIIRGADGNFSSGVDLRERDTSDGTRLTRLLTALRRVRPIVVSSVDGYALGLGAGLAMAADLSFASRRATFAYPELVHGFVPATVLIRLRELVGAHVALELLLTGRRFAAEEALALGLVNALADDGNVLDLAIDFARSIGAHDRWALASTKRFFHESADMTFSSALFAAERVLSMSSIVKP